MQKMGFLQTNKSVGTVFKGENELKQAAVVSKEEQKEVNNEKPELKRAYDKYADELFKYALMILADYGSAEDAVQQAFVKVLKMKNRTSHIESYQGYLRTAVRNECYEIIKKRNRLMGMLKKFSSAAILENTTAGEADEQQRQLLEAAIKKLSARQREVLYMKVYENKTFSQIGEMTGVSLNTAASRYRYAMDRLKQMLLSQQIKL